MRRTAVGCPVRGSAVVAAIGVAVTLWPGTGLSIRLPTRLPPMTAAEANVLRFMKVLRPT